MRSRRGAREEGGSEPGVKGIMRKGDDHGPGGTLRSFLLAGSPRSRTFPMTPRRWSPARVPFTHLPVPLPRSPTCIPSPGHSPCRESCLTGTLWLPFGLAGQANGSRPCHVPVEAPRSPDFPSDGFGHHPGQGRGLLGLPGRGREQRGGSGARSEEGAGPGGPGREEKS